MASSVSRLFVEKKSGFDIDSQVLYEDLKEFLEIEGLKDLKIVKRYDVEGITREEFEEARRKIFAEPPVDRVYEEEYPFPEEARIIAVEYLPGQYDQRADSAAQCIQILTRKEKPEIRCARILLLFGDITEREYEKIKDYYINPLDSREAELEKPDTLELDIDYPKEVETLDNFIELNQEGLKNLHSDLELAMSEDDLNFIQNYFQKEERSPTLTEIRVLDTYWSDHCRHTTFLTEITDIEFSEGPYTEAVKKAFDRYQQTRNQVYGPENDEKICLMDIGTIGVEEMKQRGLLNNLEESEEVNAASIEVTIEVDGRKEDWLVMFKNETHNHPTEIEPFGGAATCLGGAIRDPLAGRSYVYQAMRVTGAADPRTPVSETIPGKLPQRKITTEAAEGFSSYGNQIGLATGEVSEFYNEHFLAKRMEIGAVVGATPAEDVVRKSPQPGDVVILVGGRTGRDGCGGATGSSKKHTEESLDKCGAEVQKGNPPTERKLQRLFRRPEVSRMIKKCNDFGAGGVAVAVGELAPSLEIDLDAVPKKYEGLDGTELAISESQERMAVVLDPARVNDFIEYSREENLEATPVAKVTDSGYLRMKWRGDYIVDLSREFLRTHGADQYSQVLVQEPDAAESYFDSLPDRIEENLSDPEQAWLENMSRLNVCSQKGLRERFDSTIGAASVLLPYGGEHQLTPVSGMVARLPVREGRTDQGTIMTFGYNPDLALWSPFHGGLYAVLESVARSVALGGDFQKIRLALQEYFEKLGDNRSKWGKPFSALLGAYLAQTELGIPAVGGKDSMSGTFKDLDVPPTLVSFALNITDIEQTVSPEFKKEDSRLIWVKPVANKKEVPDFADLKEKYEAIHGLIKEGHIRAAAAVSTGGAAAAVSKMALGNKIGVKINSELALRDLFEPEHGSLILELDSEVSRSLLPNHIFLGTTTRKPVIKMGETRISLDKIQKSWSQTLEDVFPTEIEDEKDKPPVIKYDEDRPEKNNFSVSKTARPRVLIPVFPGTNCEYDSAQKFRRAGAEVDTMVFKNLTPRMIEDSLDEIADRIDKSQIIMLPGGFSAGDEPDGSGKFIATVFRSPRVRKAVNRLLKQRDGLMLGICNGFQALVKLGLLPYGEIREMTEDSPTLTFNSLGRHVSCMVKTRISSSLSPWLQGMPVGTEHWIPVSHGEGRFYAGKKTLSELSDKGQIATQYVNLEGNTTYDIKYNPNGSRWAVEGITDPTGRIFGKMGHSERITPGTAQNIPVHKQQDIFQAGVDYFRA